VLDQLLLDDVFRNEKESTRMLAVLHWVDGMTLQQAATEVGLSVSGVRKRLRTLRDHAATAREHGKV
jgi:RNA polymerase sigma-70 factor (ECF subfamily)